MFDLGSSVFFTGKISIQELIELYSKTEIAICPSLYEGFGFPAAEAMACQVPVIAADSGALPEVVGKHMSTGYIVPSRDPDALAQAIDYLLENPHVRKKISIAGRKRISRKFTWEKTAAEIVQVYREVISAYS